MTSLHLQLLRIAFGLNCLFTLYKHYTSKVNWLSALHGVAFGTLLYGFFALDLERMIVGYTLIALIEVKCK